VVPEGVYLGKIGLWEIGYNAALTCAIAFIREHQAEAIKKTTGEFRAALALMA
jgi:hypothetical protein